MRPEVKHALPTAAAYDDASACDDGCDWKSTVCIEPNLTKVWFMTEVRERKSLLDPLSPDKGAQLCFISRLHKKCQRARNTCIMSFFLYLVACQIRLQAGLSV